MTKIINFSILILILFIGIENSFSMIFGEYMKECDFLMDINETGKHNYDNICLNPNLTKADIQSELIAWAVTYNISNKVQACASWRQNVLQNITTYANENFKGTLLDFVTTLINVLSDNTITRVQECNKTFSIFEGNSTKHEHIKCMQKPPSSSLCAETLYPEECHKGRVPIPAFNDAPVHFYHVIDNFEKMGKEGMEKVKEGMDKLKDGIIEHKMWKEENTTQHSN